MHIYDINYTNDDHWQPLNGGFHLIVELRDELLMLAILSGNKSAKPDRPAIFFLKPLN